MTTVLRLQLRRDRVQLVIWIVVVVLLLASSVSAVKQSYGGVTERSQILALALAQPAILALRGVPNGGALGSLIWFELFTYLAVVIGLMNTFLATRHGRADEEAGRREMSAAATLPRTASLTSTLVIGVGADLVIGAGCAAGFAAFGFPATGALVAGAAFAVVGMAFLGVGALVGELAPTGRSANAISAAVVVGSYVLRAAGDALGTPHLASLTLDAAWPSWISPIGWGEQTLALTADRAGFLLLPLALFAVTTAAALVVRGRRDLGWSLLPERRGRPAASAALSGPFGLAWRLARASLIGWAIGGALMGGLTAGLAKAVEGAVAGDPAVTRILQALGNGRGAMIDLFVAAILSMTGIMAAAAAVQCVLRVREEEQSGRAETVLATSVGRVRWLLAELLTGWLAAIAVLGAAAIVAALGLVAAGNPSHGWRTVGQAAVDLPAAVLFAGIACLAAVAIPRVAVGVTWGVFALATVLGLFGALLGLDETVRNISPFSDSPAVPVHDWTGVVTLTVLCVGLPAIAAVAFRRRNIPA